MTPPHRSKQRHQAPPKNNKSADADKNSQSCLEHSSQHFTLPNLFANDIFRLLVGSQTQEDRLSKLVVMCPLGKLDLGDQHRFDPNTAFHDFGDDALTPAPRCFLWQVHEGAGWPLDLL